MGGMASTQRSLFKKHDFPEGFKYEERVLSPDRERSLIACFEHLQFREFEFRGFVGKRRTVSFGWRYDFNVRKLQQAEDIPTFLRGLRHQAAKFAALSPQSLQHLLVTEYAPGAAIGWHKDRPEFEEVIGISLGAPCVFRFSPEERHPVGARIYLSSFIRYIFCADRRAGIGSTASRLLTSCAIPSPSEVYLSRTE